MSTSLHTGGVPCVEEGKGGRNHWRARFTLVDRPQPGSPTVHRAWIAPIGQPFEGRFPGILNQQPGRFSGLPLQALAAVEERKLFRAHDETAANLNLGRSAGSPTRRTPHSRPAPRRPLDTPAILRIGGGNRARYDGVLRCNGLTRYLKMHHSARTPSRTPIFFPSS